MDGFLGTRGSLMLDVVFVALFAVVPVLGWSVWLVKRRRNYELHKRVQLVLAVVLLVTVGLFELDMRVFTDWEERAAASPYYAAEGWSPVWISLTVHLVFAIPTLLLWIYVVVAALRRFPSPAAPSLHSSSHRRNGQLAAWGMVLTAVTGWVFYWLAFVA